MPGNAEDLEYVLSNTNPHSSVRIEIETEMRARKNLTEEFYTLRGADAKSRVQVQAMDLYHVVSDEYYLRSRDHSFKDGNANHRVLRGNSKIPLLLPGYTAQSTPHMVEFTWDYSLEEFEEITGRLKPVTVIEGLRTGIHYDYLTPLGHTVPLVLAFDNLQTFKGDYSQFTEVSDESKIFDDIPFPEFKDFIRKISAGNSGFEPLLDFLSSHGPTTDFILYRLKAAERDVRIFMTEELRVDCNLIEPRIYPLISLDLHANDFDKTRRLDYYQKT